MKRLFLFLCFIYTLSVFAAGSPEEAVVIVPVADMIYEAFTGRAVDVITAYEQLPYAEVTFLEQCDRGYQLLFNERVTIMDRKGEEVLVSVPHIYYKHRKDGIAQTYYWTLAKNIMPIHELTKNGISSDIIPAAIHAHMKDLKACNENTISLSFPWCDPVTKKIYSTGTRFITTTNLDQSQRVYEVLVFDPEKMTVVSSAVPAELVVIYQERSSGDRVKDFVDLIRSWAHMSGGVIPYVWGGSSFTHVVAKDNFGIEKIIKANGQIQEVFVQHAMDNIPHTGFDCSCMISRAAQLCGIPYYLGNSWTIEYVFPPLEPDEPLEEGDIIWFPGHVVLVGNTTGVCTVIEARGYGSGYGRVHEIALEEMFKGIKTFEQLVTAYYAHEKLILLNSRGGVRAILPEFKLFKMVHVWD